MSRIAQQLCDEIVEPPLKPSKDSIRKKSLSKLLNQCSSSQESDDETTRPIIIEKRKITSRLVPNTSKAGRTKSKSKEILKKKFTDTSVNTKITGTRGCDNNCMTLLRKRDKNNCNCGQKRLNCKSIAKQVQTFPSKDYFFLSDKACAQCIETVSCGTQFLEKQSGLSTGVRKSNKDITMIHTAYNRIKQEESTTPRTAFLSDMGARRWAISRYPARGPDF